MKQRTEGERKAFLDGYAQALISIRGGSLEQSMLWLVQSAEKEQHLTEAIAKIKKELFEA